jgi:DUF2924 family protein
MAVAVAERLAILRQLSKAELSELWEKMFQKTAPPALRSDFMIPILAYRIQEQAFGSLGSVARRRLCQLALALEADPRAEIHSMPVIKPGTRLVRQWRDQTHVVNVREKSYEYKGYSYQSLSQIARLITGTRWSGPLFFGLKSTQSVKSPEAQ